ncbi:MAG: S8 family peptidase, partial [Planctomycetota bacterium]
EIRESLGDRTFRSLKYIELNRYLAVYLTSLQIEQLGPLLQQKAAGRIWSDAEKLCLVDHSIKRDDPIQSAAASRVYGADGAEIHWAVLDTGVENSHPHFGTNDNIEEMWDCTHQASTLQAPDADPIDHHGHGTHVAAIIAGTPHASSTDASARSGVGPRTKIHSYKVLDDSGRGRDSFIIRALDHIASLNQASTRNVIHGVNLSLGGPFDPETYGCGHSPICRELRRLWRQGVLVVVAAGNAGFAELQSTRGSVRANLDLSIGDPANLEESIAVGSVHLTRPLTYGTSFFSSRGPTADGRQKPDLVAPGERVRSANYAYRYAEDYIELSGTSMAAPHVSGLLAAFLSQRRELIGEPDRVKTLLLSNCTDLQRDRYVQGAGLPNLVRMLLAT